jgi:hypothetical protein
MRGRSLTGAVLTAESRTLTFDCTLTEQSSRMADVTRHPVEDGASVTDHVRQEPVTLSLQVIATTSPVGGLAEPDAQRDRTFRRDVIEIQAARELITVLCELGEFPGMVISGIDDRQDASTGEAYIASITLTEIRRAVRVVTLVPPDPADERRIQTAQDGGSQQGKQPGDREEAAAEDLREVTASTLSRLTDGSEAFGTQAAEALRSLLGAP